MPIEPLMRCAVAVSEALVAPRMMSLMPMIS